VEEGTVTLVGATTHNPMFFITAPLTSRSLLVQLTPLSVEAVRAMLDRAMRAPEGLGPLGVSADEDALNHLARLCDGDGRRALNALEIAALTTAPDAEGRRHIDLAAAQESIQKKAVVYDHDEDQHYDTISAFIKSVRGSDPHAAVYWLAKMLYAGEDPRFIVRRLVILAAEDIGNADPRALTLAMAAAHAVEFIGMPEAKLVLSQTTTYLATAPKSNSALRAIEGASADVEQGRTLAVPEHLKNVRIKTGADAAERSADYRYPHEFPKHFVPQEYVPTASRYYFPSGEGYEDIIRKRLARWDELREVAH
jgi:putative ATPase